MSEKPPEPPPAAHSNEKPAAPDDAYASTIERLEINLTDLGHQLHRATGPGVRKSLIEQIQIVRANLQAAREAQAREAKLRKED